jgi:hypothetical protein
MNSSERVQAPARWHKMRTPLVAALLAFLVVRCAWWAFSLENPDGGVLVDSRGYLLLAENLRRSGQYVADEGTDLAWPPGYPVFLNLVFSALGESLPSVALAQLMLSGVTSLLLYAIGEAAGFPRAGMVAAWLSAVSPTAALWSLTVMSETLFAFLLVGATASWVISWRTRRVVPMLLAGGLLSLSALVRPIVLVLPLLWAALAALETGRKEEARRGLRAALTLLLPVVIVVVGWSLRNQAAHGKFTFATVGGRTLLNFNMGLVVAEVRGVTRDEAMPEIASWRDPGREALEFIVAHPMEFAQVQVEGVLKSLFGFDLGVWAKVMGVDDSLQGFGITQSLLRGDVRQAVGSLGQMVAGPGTRLVAAILLLSLGQLVLVYGAIGCLLVLWLRRKIAWPSWLLLCAVTAAYLLVVPLASGTARFRIPAEPFLYLMAGLGLTGAHLRSRNNEVGGAGTAPDR